MPRNWLRGDVIESFAERQLIINNSTCFCSLIPHHIPQAVHVNKDFSFKTCFDCFSVNFTASKLFHFVIINTDLSLEVKIGGFHWILGFIAMPFKQIWILDSMLKEKDAKFYQTYFLNLVRTVEMLCLMSGQTVKIEEWKFTVATDSFQQKDYYECGDIVAFNIAGFLQNNIHLAEVISNTRDHIIEILNRPLKDLKKGSQIQRYFFQSQCELADIQYVFGPVAPFVSEFNSYLVNLTCDFCETSLKGDLLHCLDCGSVFHKGCGSYQQNLCLCFKE